MSFCKYYKLVRQVSYDSGVTWISLDEYQKGDLYENDSPDCGGGITQYRWVNVSGEYTCVGTTKYQKTKKQQSTDGGQTWTDVSPIEYGTGAVIEYNSQDCVGGNTKLSATYSNGQSYSKECDGNSTLMFSETKENGNNHTIMTSVVIGDCVTRTQNNVFAQCYSLTSVTIPNSVTSIGSWAFDNCSGLTSVTLPTGLTSIEENTFSDTRLTGITIPNTVTNIGAWAFGYCKRINSITIPQNVTSIGDHVFYACSNLTSLTVNATTPPTLGEKAFYKNNTSTIDSIIIYVPSQSVNAYKSANGWSEYADRIQAIS